MKWTHVSRYVHPYLTNQAQIYILSYCALDVHVPLSMLHTKSQDDFIMQYKLMTANYSVRHTIFADT